jgi:hypothetical protein
VCVCVCVCVCVVIMNGEWAVTLPPSKYLLSWVQSDLCVFGKACAEVMFSLCLQVALDMDGTLLDNTSRM